MQLPRLRPLTCAIVVAFLLLCFALMSLTAVLGKSATYDEPLHLVGGFVHRFTHDYRINPEDPALFGWWASLPHTAAQLQIDQSNPFFQKAAQDANAQWPFVIQTLFVQDPTHAQHLLNVSRVMFVLLGVVLGALVALWAYQVRGGWAAILAAGFYCFDANFLAHAGLVKNDVPLALMMCLMGFFTWRFGRDRRWYWLLLAALVCGVAFNVKFSAVLFGPLLVLLVFLCACLGGARWYAPLIAAIAVCVSILSITWAVYGFRYAALSDGQSMNSAAIVHKAARNQTLARYESGELRGKSAADLAKIEEDQIASKDFAMPVKLDLWLQRHHVLPEAWLYGFLFTYASSLIRPTFLLGKVSYTGCWYYFPLTIHFKTPTATLIACFTFAVAGLFALPKATSWRARAWTICALVLPPITYLAVAMTTNLNLGIRHILPIYPYLFAGLGVAGVVIIERFGKAAAILTVVLLLGVVVETSLAYPNFIPFFNVFSSRIGDGGIELLGDSNLDWGQDLPALADWQKANPDQRLYFCYFGMADPNAYGIRFINLNGGWPFSRGYDLESARSGVVAMSATALQGIYLPRTLTTANRVALNGEKPFAVLNKTIYLFHWPPDGK